MPSSITDQQLALFYRACKMDFDTTRTVIEAYFEHKRCTPEHFSDRDPLSPEVQQCLDNQIYVCLPVTPSGSSIIYHRVANSTASNYCFDNAIRTYLMTMDACLYRCGPRPGIIFLFDMANVSIFHLMRVNIKSIKKFFHYVNYCLPAQLDEVHILNAVRFFDKILMLIKPFIREGGLEKIVLHRATDDYETILKDKIPLSCLPSDFGGELESVEELHNKFRQELVDLKPYFEAEERQWSESDVAIENKGKMDQNKNEETAVIDSLEFD
ncbi:alpha-tocopherol transfer protein-like [Culicoides brevitarsis]|uniref:alpha-tocopherol transfer protein-like n=1 Tax=Culicoides brevitarsis TaxID=469753 RepID=UPI00307BB3F9